MKQKYKYQWESNPDSYETLPTRMSYIFWGILFLGWIVLTSYGAVGVNNLEINLVLIGLVYSPWFLFRIGKWVWASYYAWTYLKIDFPQIQKGLKKSQEDFSLAVVYTAWEKDILEVETAFRETLLAVKESGASKVFFYAALDSGDKGRREKRILKKVLEELIGTASKQDLCFYEQVLHLVALKQEGEGKRHYLVDAIRYVMEQGGADYYYLLDGDSFPQRSLIAEAVRYLQSYDDIGGLTFNNAAYVQGNGLFLYYTIFRFIRRMMDLAFAPTVLTGRGALIRGIIFENPNAIAYMEAHPYKTYRGYITGVTGDDKTTVYLTWASGFRTLFVPNLYVYAFEEIIPPRKDREHPIEAFLSGWCMNTWISIARQEFRYGGNNLRALYDLWPARPKEDFPITLKLWDQKYFFWSGIFGVTAMLVAWGKYGGDVVYLFLWWTFMIRTIMTLLPAVAYGYWHPVLPFVSYMNYLQTVIKIVSWCNLNLSMWSRNGKETPKINIWKPTLFILCFFVFHMLVLP